MKSAWSLNNGIVRAVAITSLRESVAVVVSAYFGGHNSAREKRTSSGGLARTRTVAGSSAHGSSFQPRANWGSRPSLSVHMRMHQPLPPTHHHHHHHHHYTPTHRRARIGMYHGREPFTFVDPEFKCTHLNTAETLRIVCVRRGKEGQTKGMMVTSTPGSRREFRTRPAQPLGGIGVM